jgi:hypothetical protein
MSTKEDAQPPVVYIEPEPLPAGEALPAHIEAAWRTQGCAVVDGLWPDDAWQAALADAMANLPADRKDFGSGGILESILFFFFSFFFSFFFFFVVALLRLLLPRLRHGILAGFFFFVASSFFLLLFFVVPIFNLVVVVFVLPCRQVPPPSFPASMPFRCIRCWRRPRRLLGRDRFA